MSAALCDLTDATHKYRTSDTLTWWNMETEAVYRGWRKILRQLWFVGSLTEALSILNSDISLGEKWR